MEVKTLTEYRQPSVVVVAFLTREVIAISPEMDFTMTAYDEEEW